MNFKVPIVCPSKIPEFPCDNYYLNVNPNVSTLPVRKLLLLFVRYIVKISLILCLSVSRKHLTTSEVDVFVSMY